MHVERALDNIDANIKKSYDVNVLTAMTWFKGAWNKLPEAVITNCWTHTGLINMGKDVLAENCEDVNLSQPEKQVAELVPPRQRMSIAMLLNTVMRMIAQRGRDRLSLYYTWRRSRTVVAHAVVMVMAQVGYPVQRSSYLPLL